MSWRLDRAMKREKLSTTAPAQRLGTLRTEIYRALDSEREGVSLGMLKKAAAAVGKRIARAKTPSKYETPSTK
jgi:hypothetical protein